MRRFFPFALVSLLFLSGCSLPIPFLSTGGHEGSVFKSTDAGATFEPKVTINDKQKITTANVLSVALHPTNPDIIYIGTAADGIFRTENGGEEWSPVAYPPQKVYGLALDPQNGDRLFATGSYEEVGKIYVSDNAGADFREIYTEPGTGTVITALAIHPLDTQVLYAGTSSGVVIKSTDGGNTWKNVTTASGPVTQILFDRANRDLVFLVLHDQGTSVSRDSGLTFMENQGQGITERTYQNVTDPNASSQPETFSTVIADPSRSGVYYAGAANGLFRSEDTGKTWKAIDIIATSKNFPIRAVAVNPTNSNEIVYASGNAFYKSIDGGIKWATTNLPITRGVSYIFYNPANPSQIYFTLRAF